MTIRCMQWLSIATLETTPALHGSLANAASKNASLQAHSRAAHPQLTAVRQHAGCQLSQAAELISLLKAGQACRCKRRRCRICIAP